MYGIVILLQTMKQMLYLQHELVEELRLDIKESMNMALYLNYYLFQHKQKQNIW